MAEHAGKIAVPVTKPTVKGAAEQFGLLRRMGVPLVELRFDAMRDLSPENLRDAFMPMSGPRVIATITHHEEVVPPNPALGFRGSTLNFGATEAEREAYLNQLSELAGYVTMEHKYYHKLRGRESMKIVSVHLGNTPSIVDLKRLYINMMYGTNSDIVKIATVGSSMEDSLSMLKLAWEISTAGPDYKPIIPVVMGEAGKIVRVLGPYYGAAVTFARVGEGSAPGQIDYHELLGLMANAERIGIPDMAEPITAKQLTEYASAIGLRT